MMNIAAAFTNFTTIIVSLIESRLSRKENHSITCLGFFTELLTH